MEIKKHAALDFCEFQICSGKYYFYRGLDCMDKCCEILKIETSEIINFEQKKMLPLKIEELELHKELHKTQKVYYVSEEQFGNRNFQKVKDCHITVK